MTVTTRRERRQQQRQQQRRSPGGGGTGSRGISQVWIIVGVVAIVVALILVARATGAFDAPASTTFDINDAKYNTAGASIGEHKDEVSKFHVPTGQKVDFASLPPTSGDHWAAPAAPAPWGVKTAWLPWEVTIHNLEHGGIVILYGADVTSDQVNTLRLYVRQLQSSGFPKIILEPWPDMPKDAKVMLTAWNWVMKLPGIDQTSIVKFTKAHHASSEAPEPNVP